MQKQDVINITTIHFGELEVPKDIYAKWDAKEKGNPQ